MLPTIIDLRRDINNTDMDSITRNGIDLTNQVINGYRVLHRLGFGGMAEVYLAFHETLQRHVALKVMRPAMTESPENIQRFLQEARSAASLVHRNIVQVYDIGSWDGLHYIAQEYVSGSTLRDLVQKRGSLSQSESISIVLQIAAALQKAASIGVIHRDIKPDNILLNSEGEVKVADFGLARAENNSLTATGVTLGTPLYMSPEQIQGQSIDARSDLYSLGVTAFELLTGSPPFQGETALSLALQHVQNAPPDLAKLRPDLDSEWVGTINKLLSKSTEDRFASASDLVRAIKAIADRLSLGLTVDHPIPLAGISNNDISALRPTTVRLQNALLQQKKSSSIARPLNSLSVRTTSKIAQFASRRRALFVSCAALSIAAMCAIVCASLPRSPIIEAPSLRSASIVKKMPDVQQQYFAAMMANSAAGWRVIEVYFPPKDSPVNLNYNVKAWLHLAWLGLDYNNLAEASEATNKILSTNTSDTVSRVLALATRSLVQLRMRNTTDSSFDLREAKQIFMNLPESDRQLVEESLPRSALNHWHTSKFDES